MIADLHVHTRFSVDSEALMEDYCDAALERGVGCICFVDHIDLNKRDIGYGYYDCEGYFAELGRARVKYGHRLRVLSGMEFGEPHVYKDDFARLSAMPYDFVLGSIHFWQDDLFASELVKHGVPLKDGFDTYWRAVLETVRCGGFDSLAHLDFPKRYYGDSVEDYDVITEIFTTMIERGIALEINTSTLRKGFVECMPHKGLLKLYKSLGGSRVTVGSDAHTVPDLAAHIDHAKAVIQDIGLEEVIFIQRKAVSLV